MNKLEEAAREYASCDIAEGGLTGLQGMDASKYDPFIAGAQWQAKQSPWISVEEYLPPNLHKNVLLKVENSGVFVGLGLNAKESDLKITHWCPIPELPKE